MAGAGDAASGAATGGMMGGPWGAAIGAGVGVLGGLLGGGGGGNPGLSETETGIYDRMMGRAETMSAQNIQDLMNASGLSYEELTQLFGDMSQFDAGTIQQIIGQLQAGGGPLNASPEQMAAIQNAATAGMDIAGNRLDVARETMQGYVDTATGQATQNVLGGLAMRGIGAGSTVGGQQMARALSPIYQQQSDLERTGYAEMSNLARSAQAGIAQASLDIPYRERALQSQNLGTALSGALSQRGQDMSNIQNRLSLLSNLKAQHTANLQSVQSNPLLNQLLGGKIYSTTGGAQTNQGGGVGTALGAVSGSILQGVDWNRVFGGGGGGGG